MFIIMYNFHQQKPLFTTLKSKTFITLVYYQESNEVYSIHCVNKCKVIQNSLKFYLKFFFIK